MKIKFKLSIVVTIIVAVVVVSISIMLLNQASDISRELGLQATYYLADHQSEFWKGRQDGYLRVLRTLTNIMSNYEGLAEGRRREIYDEMLESTLIAEPIRLCLMESPLIREPIHLCLEMLLRSL